MVIILAMTFLSFFYFRYGVCEHVSMCVGIKLVLVSFHIC